MIFTGKIQDKDGALIPGATLLFLNESGNPIVKLPTSTGTYRIDSTFDWGLFQPGITIRFEAPGYGYYGVDAYSLPESFTVTLEKTKNTVAPWMIAAVLAAVLVYQRSRKKVGKFGPDDLRMIFMIVGGLIGWVILKQILEMLGFWDSEKEKKLELEASDPKSPWNPNFWSGGNPYAAAPMSETAALAVAKIVYKELGVFWDNEDKVISAIHSLQTKAEVSFVAFMFKKEYDRDLFTYLRNGPGSMPWHGLSETDVTSLNLFVQKLPNY